MNRKHLTKIAGGAAALGLAATALTGCGGGSASAPTGGGDGETDTITLLTFFDPAGTSGRETGFKQVVDAFTAETGITVEYTTFPWDRLESQLLLSVQSGRAPDVAFVRDRSLEQLIAAGALESLNPRIDADLDADYIDDFVTLQGTTADDEVYGFPISVVGTALYLREDMLASAGVSAPATWDEFVAVGEAVQTPATKGFLFNGSQTQPNQLDFLQSLIEGRGGQVLDEDGRAAFNSEAGVEAFEFLKASVFDYEISPADVSTLSYDQVTDSFNAGRGAMTINGSHRYSVLSDGVGAENLGVSMIPGMTADAPSPTVVSSWSLGIPQGAQYSDAAWQFIEFFSSAEQVLEYAKASGEVPSKKSVLEDPFFADREVTRFFSEYIAEYGSPAVVGPANTQLNDIIARTVQRVVSSADSDVQALLDAAAAEYDAIVD
ncbi:sugar ABC transporter substrate-binding protein [Microbacterium aurantiacum]|uniref:Sugar ABC transporter substrate-binding protein n=1 Tax=Microbacterium aurantiacum TaxID=162393 RepID=A0AAJ2M103_9MICO|nr:sugar ABC transporter substrate-binding protein [Microbacterium aurantiacum]MDS0246969.1 sugar ABC transporter substrate-binding protein [Microbacterium aurantiacum]